MRVARAVVAFAGVVSLWPAIVFGQDVLTLSDVLNRARERAPEILSARLAVDEAKGRLSGASLRFQSNPEFDLSLGNRRGLGTRSTDVEFGIGQTFEPASKRGARVRAATAQVEQVVASAEDTTRAVLRESAAQFFDALFATERTRLLGESEALASAIVDAADRRYRAGDLAILDVNLARASLARTRAERQASEAERIAAVGELQVLLGLEGVITVQGSLALGPAPTTALLEESAKQRPELRTLESAIREADADVALARAFRRPDYGASLRFQREGADHVLLGGLTITLPTFAKGQELQATGTARGLRLRADLDAARARIRTEVRTAVSVYERRAAAARLLETDALPGIDENVALAARSFDVGQIGLPDVLLIRREILETRFQYLSALREAALARVDVDAVAAVLR